MCDRIYSTGNAYLSYVGEVYVQLFRMTAGEEFDYLLRWKVGTHRSTELGYNYNKIIVETGKELLPEYYVHPHYGEMRVDDAAAIRYAIDKEKELEKKYYVPKPKTNATQLSLPVDSEVKNGDM